MRIDVHAHYWTERYLDRLADLGEADTGGARALGAGGGSELDARLRLMDRAGIDIQMLCGAADAVRRRSREGRRDGQFVNDEYAELVEGHKDRFRAFAALPMPHVEESLGEMRRALDDLHMAGVVMNTTILGRALVGPDYEPIFAELNERSGVL